MMRVAITGGIGSGKSLVCKVFELLGVPIFYADEASKTLLSEVEVKQQVVSLFGSEAYLADGKPNRKYLADCIFKNAKLRDALNAFLHPLVIQQYETWCNQHKDFPYTVKESALLFESGFNEYSDCVLLVTSPEKLRLERIAVRDKLSETEIRRRMESQLPDVEKTRRADFVLMNDEQTLMIPKILALHETLLSHLKARSAN